MASYGKVNVLQEEPGTIKTFGGASAPSGWLLCDGTAVSRTTFAALFNAIGTSFGSGDGSTTFNLPDFRGASPAGAGTSVGYTENETITLGAKHNDQMQGWQLGASADTNGARNYWAITYDRDTFPFVQTADSGKSIIYESTSGQGTSRMLKAMNDGTNGTPRTGKTTRGKVVGVNFIIKH